MTKLEQLRLLGSRLHTWQKRMQTALIGSYICLGMSLGNYLFGSDWIFLFVTITMAILSVSLHFISHYFFKINYQKSKQLSQDIKRELFNGH